MSSKESNRTKFLGLRIVTLILCAMLVIMGIVSLIYGSVLDKLYNALPFPSLVESIVQMVVGALGILGALRLAKFVLGLFLAGVVTILIFLVVLLVYLALTNTQLLLQEVVVVAISMAFGTLLIIMGVLLFKRAQRVCC
jgi:hypothetical protein